MPCISLYDITAASILFGTHLSYHIASVIVRHHITTEKLGKLSG